MDCQPLVTKHVGRYELRESLPRLPFGNQFLVRLAQFSQWQADRLETVGATDFHEFTISSDERCFDAKLASAVRPRAISTELGADLQRRSNWP